MSILPTQSTKLENGVPKKLEFLQDTLDESMTSFFSGVQVFLADDDDDDDDDDVVDLYPN